MRELGRTPYVGVRVTQFCYITVGWFESFDRERYGRGGRVSEKAKLAIRNE